MAIREMLINWSVTNAKNATTILYFDELVKTDAQLPTAVADAILHQVSLFNNGTKAAVSKGGKVYDPLTGEYLRDWGLGTAPTVVTGTQSGSAVPNASMGLIRYKTAAIVNNRRLQGRSFIPGLSAVGNANGELNDPTMTGLAALGAEWLGAGLQVWHRPTFDPESGDLVTPGLADYVSGISVWREYAVQRRRRQ